MVAPFTGVAAGGLMAIMMVVYLLAGAVDHFTYEPAGARDDGPRFFLPIGFGALLIGLLTLGWAVRALRWRVSD
jgi:hypothetical protein